MEPFFKVKIPRDDKYTRWVATNSPCLVRGCSFPSDTIVPHHPEVEGKNLKCSDYRVVPLCYEHHLGQTGVHQNKKTFWEDHGIDIEAVINELNRRWKNKSK